MEKKTYESPKFDFQQMNLTERIADKCWGYNYVFIDADGDPKTPAEKYYWIDESSGCQGNDENSINSRLSELISYMAKHHPDFNETFKPEDVWTNVKDSLWLDPPVSSGKNNKIWKTEY